jgi:2-polyprenyl-3-methyl-5-hydroxy-6-metoxy-1,4-benzoquinol methylase
MSCSKSELFGVCAVNSHRLTVMDRSTWLSQRRVAVVEEYDADAASWQEYSNDAQQRWVGRLLAECVPGGVVLDAPCGTGRYFPLVADAGLRVVGIDQSEGMLGQARGRGIAEALHLVGLQEMLLEGGFDAAMTIDAMENVPPEDWLIVLDNLHRAVQPSGYLYLTVEETSDAVIDTAHADLVARGLPAVRGEVVRGGVTGYHYYPTRAQVLAWLSQANWRLIDEGFTPENGWGYWHLLARRG